MKRVIISLLALSGLMISGLVQAEGSVARAIITTGVADREPVNNLERVLAGNEKVLFFTELRGMAGQTVKHRWSYGGEVQAEVEINVGGPRWRAWSSKNLIPEWAGDWNVAVVDAEGNVLSEKDFEFAGDGSARKASASDEPEDGAAEQDATEAVGDMPETAGEEAGAE